VICLGSVIACDTDKVCDTTRVLIVRTITTRSAQCIRPENVDEVGRKSLPGPP
jgi:hypothetical protein